MMMMMILFFRLKKKFNSRLFFLWNGEFFFLNPLSDTLRHLYNLIPCSCVTKILIGLLYVGTLLYILYQLVVGYLFVVAMYLHLYVVRLTPFDGWRDPFFLRVPRCQYVVAPERVTNKNTNKDIR